MKVYCINFQPVEEGKPTNSAVKRLFDMFRQFSPEVYYFLTSYIGGYEGKNLLCMSPRQLRVYSIVESIAGKLRVPKHIKRTLLEKIVDYNLCKQLKKETEPFLLITTMYSVKCTSYAKKRGCKVLFWAANLNDNLYYEVVKQEQKRLGLNYTDVYCSDYRINVFRKMLSNVDYVWCPNPLSAWSFKEKNTILDPRLRKMPHVSHPKQYDGKIPERIKIGYFGHTTLLKGVHLLAEAAAKCHNKDNIEFVLAGSVDSRVRSLLDKSNVHFTYLGSIPESEKWSTIQSFDFMVVPSLYDAGPTTIVEAFTCDVPAIISTGCGGVDRVKNSEKCITFQTMNIEDLAEKLDYAYEHRSSYLHNSTLKEDEMESPETTDYSYFTKIIEKL